MLFAHKRKDIGATKLFYLFSAFILFCGITHFIGIFTIWHGIYGIHGLSKVFTAAVSLTTAIYVYKLIPTAITIPTPAQYKTVEQQLSLEKQHSSSLRNELDDFKFSQFMLNSMPIGAIVLDKSCNTMYSNETFARDFSEQASQAGFSFLDSLPLNAKEQLANYFSSAGGEEHSKTLFLSTS